MKVEKINEARVCALSLSLPSLFFSHLDAQDHDRQGDVPQIDYARKGGDEDDGGAQADQEGAGAGLRKGWIENGEKRVVGLPGCGGAGRVRAVGCSLFPSVRLPIPLFLAPHTHLVSARGRHFGRRRRRPARPGRRPAAACGGRGHWKQKAKKKKKRGGSRTSLSLS